MGGIEYIRENIHQKMKINILFDYAVTIQFQTDMFLQMHFASRFNQKKNRRIFIKTSLFCITIQAMKTKPP